MTTQLPTAYLNGHLLPLTEARISPLDRGFLFGEGVYEVIPVYGGRPLNYPLHRARLMRSLDLIEMPCPVQSDALDLALHQLIEANGSGDLSVYLQITRGVSETVRNHIFPQRSTPTVFAMCQSLEPRDAAVARDGVRAITLADERWARCDIKSTSLLANTLARQRASEAGAAEAILTRDGLVTEGAASSAFVIAGETVMQPPPCPGILPGTTAPFVRALLQEAGIATTTEPITTAQLAHADEIWLASATREVLPVTRLDDEPVGTGTPGPLWRRLDALYQDAKRAPDHE